MEVAGCTRLQGATSHERSNMCQTTRRHSSNFQSLAWETRMSSSGFRISFCYVFFILFIANRFTLFLTLHWMSLSNTQQYCLEFGRSCSQILANPPTFLRIFQFSSAAPEKCRDSNCSRSNSTKYPLSGAGKISERRLIRQVERVRQVVCA